MKASKGVSTQKKVQDFVRRHGLVKPGQKVLAAVSGGADSVCLLHVLNQLKDDLQISLHIAHLNHQLRAEESAADATFVLDLGKKLNIPVTLEKREVAVYQAENRLSLEEAAREVRYRFLAETAQAIGAACTAVGHTQNDQVETILLHIIRGTGTKGLTGLQPTHVWCFPEKPLTVIRPLLELSRQEIEDYCRSHDLDYRQDSSNLSQAMLRNRVRLELLPLLEQYNPNIAGSLLRIRDIAHDEAAYLDVESAREWPRVTAKQGRNILFDKRDLLALAPALQRQLLRRALEELLGSLKDVETRHIEEMMAALQKPAGRKLNLPEGLVFSNEYVRYILGFDIQSLIPFPALSGVTTLSVPGTTAIPGWTIQSQILPLANYSNDPESRENWQNDGFTADFDSTLAGSGLTLRNLLPGDSFQPLGLAQTKKVARFMLDSQIPHDWRSRVPLICNSQQIIWVAGWRIDERVKVTSATRSILRVKLIRR